MTNDLTPFQRWQLATYGDVLGFTTVRVRLEDPEEQEHREPASEETEIFNRENPEDLDLNNFTL